MQIEGHYSFDTPITKVWDLLIDPDIVAQCLPGCEKLEPLGNDRYRVTLRVAIAAISGKFGGILSILEKKPPHSYKLLVDGSGSQGFVKGRTSILLKQDGKKTLVHVSGDLQVGGLIARVGQRMLGSVSKMMMDRFYTCLGTRASKC